jgi:hypothetical protein
MNWKKLLLDPSLWILLFVNIFLIYSYEQNPKIFTTLIWLYWSQSVLFGLFNFLDMLTPGKKTISELNRGLSLKENDKGLAKYAAWGFLFHFGFFHFGYYLSLARMEKTGSFGWGLYRMFLIFFLVSQIINFIYHKMQDRKRPASISKQFFTPYLRILPMHLCILLPVLFNWSNLTVFLILKMITDVLMYIITTSYYWKKDSGATVARKDINAIVTSE